MHPLKRDFSSIKENIISEYLSGQSSTKLGKKYNCSASTICKFLQEENIPRRKQNQAQRKYKIKEDFFDKINTPIHAYILGLLYADGNNNTTYGVIRLGLTADDKKLLEKISSLIYYDDKPLYLSKGGPFKASNGKIYIRKDSYYLTISNRHISDTLNIFGLVKAKSLILEFPKWLDKELIPHFIRGYFDGDGCISFSKKDCCITISIAGTNNFCTHLGEILKELNIKHSIYPNKSIYYLSISGGQASRKFLEWIYKDAEIYLERKYLRYQEYLKLIPPARNEFCKICGAKHSAKGYCNKHYQQFIIAPRDKKRRLQARLDKLNISNN